VPRVQPGGPGLSAGAKGVIVSIASSVSFGLVYFLTPLLYPMSGEAVWAMRALFSVPLIAFALVASRDWRLVTDIGRRLRRKPLLLFPMLLSAVLVSAQIWLFAWAPLNGRSMQVALGYFLLPLMLVLLGRLLYKDRMVWWQWAAAGTALIGVVYEIFRVGGLSWETVAVALGYPGYFVLRRAMGTGHLGGMWWDFALFSPIAIAVLVWSFADGTWLQQNPSLWWAAPGVSLFAAFALVLYLVASRLLSMSLFGLLSYVEPAMLLVASLLLGERIASEEFFTYGAIWAAVLILVLGGAFELRRKHSR
jgi:chloramphenicol-sensitive protein RarD